MFRQACPVFLYIPNIIGYIRILLLAIFPLFALKAPLMAFSVYFSSAILDAVDGHLARRLGQESYLGAVLDYTIDRASLAVIQIVLALVYPQYWGFFALVLALDLASHVFHIYSSLFLKRSHHKEVNLTQGKLMYLYYTNRPVLFFICFFHDLWFAFIYFYHFYPNQTWVLVGSLVCLPGFLLKTFIHVAQIWASLQAVIALDEGQ